MPGSDLNSNLAPGDIQFDYGLEEGRSLTTGTLVNLLKQDVFLGVRDDYCARSRKFGEPLGIVVPGRG